ncbi:MAG: carbamoyltransferase C-terminal domain-containing protein, partial [Gammaproteobacteria bacterium]
LYEGRSEMGPRALCHRSVLANPTDHGNWARVNGIKGREAWRPFAPVVIEEKMQDWFAGCPTHSPYMLFTARVRSRRLPAITHVDGSSRIQTVSAETGAIYQILREFDALTGIPVLMNTSLNGPGVPIVERPDEAYELFKDSAVDVLYLNGMRIGKK